MFRKHFWSSSLWSYSPEMEEVEEEEEEEEEEEHDEGVQRRVPHLKCGDLSVI
jgi:hypothetical protein